MPGNAAVTFEDRASGRPNIVFQGAWAWFHLLDAAQIRSVADHYEVTFEGRVRALVRIDAMSVLNPFGQRDLQQFRCDDVVGSRSGMSLVLEVGFYGKLPSHGDFLRRRVSDAFVGSGTDGSRMPGGQPLVSRRSVARRVPHEPGLAFACASGICGPAPVIGVMVPSVDRVGQYFR